jgi:hypothetical protein
MIFNFFRKKPPLPEVLYFKNAQGAFEYSCQYSHAEVTVSQPRVAIIEDSSGSRDEKGFQNAILRVAGYNDYFKVIASTAAPFVPPLSAGELVLWVPMDVGPMVLGVSDKRMAWLGLIVGVLAPEMIVKTNSYRMKIDYRDYVRT